MACGTPVLALPGGAVAEVLRNGTNGWICRDAADMATHLATPLPDSRACREFAERHFGLDQMVNGYLEVYRRLGAGHEVTLPAALEAEWRT